MGDGGGRPKVELSPALEALLISGRDKESPVVSPRDIEGDNVDVQRHRIRHDVKQDVNEAQAKWAMADVALQVLLKSRDDKLRGKPKKKPRRGPPLRTDPADEAESLLDAASLKDSCDNEEEGRILTDKELRERSEAANRAAAERSAARGATKAGTRRVAVDLRAKMARVKAAECAIREQDRSKRRLRAKVVEVLKDIQRRQQLAWQQERGQRVREQRHAAGLGPHPDLGNATQFTLQASITPENEPGLQNASPRRVALLGVLTMEEMELLRSDPAFFFQKNHSGSVSSNAAAKPDPAADTTSTVTVDEVLPLPQPPRRAWDDTEALWELTRFFQPRKEDRDMGVAEWAQQLRTRLAGMQGEGQAAGTAFPWLVTDEAEPIVRRAEPFTMRVHEEPLEKMPCHQRRPLVPPGDANSAVLAKVREVYSRREVADAKLIEERRQAVEQRFAHNAFKAREQQRELQLKSTTQKELHKVQMLDVEERKRLLEASSQERREQMDLGLRRQVAEACLKADELVEARRNAASETLRGWQQGVSRAHKINKELEAFKAKEGLRFVKQHNQRLQKLGEARHGQISSIEQRNEQLRAHIQTSLNSQMEAHRQHQAGMLSEAIDAKLEAAAMRRIQGATRYHFREKAFGMSASELDLKHLPAAVDRRQESWRKSAQSWAKQSLSFSAPSLPSPSASKS